MRAAQPHTHPVGAQGDQHYPPAELHHSRRNPLVRVQAQTLPQREEHASPQHEYLKNTDQRRNRYYRTDRGDENTVAARSSSNAVKKQVSNWSHKTRDEILCELFLEKNIDLRSSRKLGCGRYSKVITGHFVSNGHAVSSLPESLSSLQGYRATNRPVKEHQAMIWMSQVISAVYYMHTRGIVHRDLKLENIVIFPDEGIIKISDFGFARSVIRGDALSETYCGSKSYSAPEILKGEPYDPYKSDVWSVGVIAFVIVTDCMPYFVRSVPNPQIVEAQRLRAYEYPAKLHLSAECRFSIDTMMTFSWRDRPNISHCGCLPWFQSLPPNASHGLKIHILD
ncbi:kinase domain protein [Ostertagia ostertagi]